MILANCAHRGESYSRVQEWVLVGFQLRRRTVDMVEVHQLHLSSPTTWLLLALNFEFSEGIPS